MKDLCMLGIKINLTKHKHMKLVKALKQKNRLAGELSRLTRIFERENCRRNDNPSKVDVAAVWENIQSVSDELGVLKGKIATANVGIYPQLERMAELKSRISLLDALHYKEGEEVSYLDRENKVVYNWTAFINREKADQIIAELQKEVDRLQDEVDEFNAVTEIA